MRLLPGPGPALLCAAVCCAAAARAAVPLTSTELRLPSDGAGTGGTLAVRLTYPASAADYRYSDGAPVAIYLPGGFAAGALGAPPQIPWQGFVLVTFLFPGGHDGATSSDGVYDFRGESCQRAVRDIMRFAEGAATDSLGRTIDDVVPGPVHPGIVGLAPFSNGLIGLITLDRFGAEIPYAPHHGGWENPTNGQIVAVELGAIGQDCDAAVDSDGNGLAADDARNPWHDPATGYSPTSLAVDFSRLAYDSLYSKVYTDPTGWCSPVQQLGAVLHDGLANGRVDFNPANPQCLDYDGDGAIEKTEDYLLSPVTTFNAACLLKVFYSDEVTAALDARGIFPGQWPVWVGNPVQAAAFWDLHDVTGHFDGLSARFPDLRAITVFSQQDHVQSQTDHPHVRQIMDGFVSRGHWFRLNADALYFASVAGALPPGYVETPAGAQIPYGRLKSHGEPKGTASGEMGAAAHAELADRVHSGCWWPDLGQVLRPLVPPDSEVGTLTIDADARTIRWTAAAGAFCYDLLRGEVARIADGGTVVLLSGATCADDDSPDTVATDEATPSPGQAYYYLVKPNGVHGAYGQSSAGQPRADLDRGCGG